jgi:glycosyltransferase involved in cell wall biosynthesis
MIKISIVVPVYNEEQTIIEVLSSIKRQKISDIEFEVVVVDDGSIDSTPQLLTQHTDLYTKNIRLNKNRGKGFAVREGIREATGEYVLFQDADLEYTPDDYTTLIEPVKMFEADLIVGSRFVAPVYSRVAYFWHKVGNRLITLLFNITNNLTFTDIYTCYILFKREHIDPDELITNGWEQQAELLTKVAKKSKIIYEVPISYHGRTYAEGKKIRAYHTIAIIYSIIRFKLFS